MLALPTPSTPRTVLLTTRERGINADKKGVNLNVCLCGRRQGASVFVSTVSPARRAAFTAPALLASLLFFFVMRACNKRCLELVIHGFTSEGLVVLVGDLRSKSGNRVEFLRLCSSEHCANDFGDFGVLHCVHQCVLGTSRVALRLGCCSPRSHRLRSDLWVVHAHVKPFTEYSECSSSENSTPSLFACSEPSYLKAYRDDKQKNSAAHSLSTVEGIQQISRSRQYSRRRSDSAVRCGRTLRIDQIVDTNRSRRGAGVHVYNPHLPDKT